MSNTATETGASRAETFLCADDFIAQLHEASGLKISKSAFLKGVKAGKFPQPYRLLPRRPTWKKSDLATLINSL